MRRPFPLTIDWAGAPDFPEVDEGSGTIISRVDWTAPTTVIENVVTGSGNDRIFDDPNANTNNSMNGSPGCEFFIGNGGNYTYNGGTGLEGCFGLYADEFTDFGGPPPRSSDTYVFPRVFGHDGMIDIHGTADLVDLSAYSTTDLASATPLDLLTIVETSETLGFMLGSDGYIDSLVLNMKQTRDDSGLTILAYYDNTSDDLSQGPGGQGHGYIETIKFSDGPFTYEAAGSPALSLQSAGSVREPDKEFDGEVKVEFEGLDLGERVPRR